ncbi:MAG: hypothetical protein HY286_16395, partial [Planctomycetes bacterium]|nr:hypothetical protein [Planctomycetota bacterium]
MKLTTLAFVGAAALASASLVSNSLFAVTPGGNNPPFFVAPSPCNQEFLVTPGQTLCFDVAVQDAENDFIVLNWNDVPFTATTNPPTVVGGNGFVTTQFCFTPGPADVGQTYLAIFFSFDPNMPGGANTPKCDIKITVENGLSAEVTDFSAKAGGIGGPVKVHWETSSEIDNAYFNIFRSESTLDKAIQINA